MSDTDPQEPTAAESASSDAESAPVELIDPEDEHSYSSVADLVEQPAKVMRIGTESELRIDQAQLVGWLEGLIRGIQTAIYAQQMAARSQLEDLRRALPPGMSPGHPMAPTHEGADDNETPGPNGMYL